MRLFVKILTRPTSFFVVFYFLTFFFVSNVSTFKTRSACPGPFRALIKYHACGAFGNFLKYQPENYELVSKSRVQ